MEHPRSEIDDVIEQMRAEQAARSDAIRGKLKIFFGYAAGVGKTYSMLEAARAQLIAGEDVVIGYVEPHSRPETEALTLGLEALPPRRIEYRGMRLQEFDLDAALARRPALLIVDELAHTDAPGPGSRHAKRWQDIEELLDAGINVYTTLNIQHIESLNDVVAQIAGIQVRETIPDKVFDEADSIELVDLPPEELLERFREGKVYVPSKSEQAMANFFRLANLVALREMALRRIADRVAAQVESARQAAGGAHVWATNERLLVCVGPSPTSPRIIRIAKRLASSLRASWIAVYVDSGAGLGDAARQKLTANLRLAEELGAETATLSGTDVAGEIVSYAHARNVTKIVIGKTGVPWWRELLGRSIVSRLVRRSGDIDVYVIRGREEEARRPATKPAGRAAMPVRGYLASAAAVAACSLLAAFMQQTGLSEINQAMVYLLGVSAVAAFYGRGPGVLASVLSVLLFDFLFVSPRLTFAVDDTQYFITFGVMLVIAVLISTLTHRIRQQVAASRERERRTEALYRLSRKLAGTSGPQQLVATAEAELSDSLGCEVAIFLPNDLGRLQPTPAGPSSFAHLPHELAVAQWAFEHREMAGAGTATLPDANALYLPMLGSQGAVGVLGVRSLELDRFASPGERQKLRALADQTAIAIERGRFAEQAQSVLVQVETERLRSSLLSSLSHDLRTPLTAISGASSSMIESGGALDEPTRRELLQTIFDESNRLSLLVENLLSITRIESGAIVLNRQWNSVEEALGSALSRLRRPLEGRAVHTHLPGDLPLVLFDGVLIEQVLINLLENAIKYTPADQPIDIAARAEGKQVLVEVADRGPGIAPADLERVFEKFYRGPSHRGLRGAGLGLPICRSILQVHGGRIWAEQRPGGGTRFLFALPLEGEPPRVEPEVEAVSQEHP